MRILSDERVAIAFIDATSADAVQDLPFNLASTEGIIINEIEFGHYQQAFTAGAYSAVLALTRDLNATTVTVDGTVDEAAVDVREIDQMFVGGQKVLTTSGSSNPGPQIKRTDFRPLAPEQRPKSLGDLRFIFDEAANADNVDIWVQVKFQFVDFNLLELGLLRARGQ